MAYYDFKREGIRFFPAFIASLVICLAIIYGFAMIGAENDPYLIQAELVLTLLALSLTGVLTKSKLKSLAAVVCVPIVYYVPIALGIFSPWGFFTELTGPEGILSELFYIADNLFQRTGATPLDIERAQIIVNQYGWLLDVGVLFFCALFVAVLVTIFFTGVGRGTAMIFSLILKLIAIVFLVFFLFILPLFYYGLATAAKGVSYVGIGATHSYMALEELSDPQNPNIDYNYVLTELAQASPAFNNASAAFEETEANLLASFALTYFDYDEEFKAIKYFLKAGAYMTAPEGLGEFILGFKDFRDGLNITMSHMTFFGSIEPPSQKAAGNVYTQNTNFTQGLVLLESGIAHFRNGIPNLLKALDEVQKGVELLADLNNPDIDRVAAQIPLAKNAVIVMENVSLTIIPLMNGTYLITQAFSLIKTNQFAEASNRVSAARPEIDRSRQLFLNISEEIDETNTLSPVHFAVYALRDLTTFSSSFVSAANHAIDAFLSMADLVILLMDLDLDLTNLPNIDWEYIKMRLDFANNNITQADSDLTIARSNVREFMGTNYGPLNETFHPVMGTLNESLDQISSIVGGVVPLWDLMNNIYFAVFNFAQGLDLVQNEQFEEAVSAFNASIANATAAQASLDEIEVLESENVNKLKEVLGLMILTAELARTAAQNFQSDPSFREQYESHLDLLEDVFGADFGSQIFFPSPLVESAINHGFNTRVIARTDKCLPNGNINRLQGIPKRIDGNDWTFFSFAMIINLLGIRKINKKLRKSAKKISASE